MIRQQRIIGEWLMVSGEWFLVCSKRQDSIFLVTFYNTLSTTQLALLIKHPLVSYYPLGCLIQWKGCITTFAISFSE